MFKQLMEKNAYTDAQLASRTTSIRNLEVQMGQNSQSLNTRPRGALPSDTVANSKGENNMKQVMVVVRRSDKGEMHQNKVKRELWKMNMKCNIR